MNPPYTFQLVVVLLIIIIIIIIVNWQKLNSV